MLVNGNQARTSEQLCEIERGEGGGGGTLVTRYWGGTQETFSY